jgi:predicted amidohydrolase
VQIVGCQLDIVWEDPQANYQQVRALLAKKTIQSGALIVLPEMFATGFSMATERTAEPANGPTIQFLQQLAREYSAFIIGGVTTQNGDGRGRNEAVVVDPAGKEILRYCKLHPFSPGGENLHFARGDSTKSFACQQFQVAPFICYDLRFPEIFRQATRAGAHLLVVIANWPEMRDMHWQALLCARAIENQAYVIGVNRAGNDPKLKYLGHSVIFDPRGQQLARAGEGAEIIQAELQLESLLEYRRSFPVLQDFRAEFFPAN